VKGMYLRVSFQFMQQGVYVPVHTSQTGQHGPTSGFIRMADMINTEVV